MPVAKPAAGSEHDPVAERQWIEQFVMLQELGGQRALSRAASRIHGLMIIADEAEFTQAELAERLGASHAAVSPAVRQLIEAGYVERFRTPGVRSDQFRLLDIELGSLLHAASLNLQAQVEHLDRGRALPGPHISGGRAHLAKRTALYHQFLEVIAEATERLNH